MVRKYPSLKIDLEKLITKLSKNPNLGVNLGHNLYKIRLAISSKGRGKSGGARVITFLISEDKEIYLVYIYDKSRLDNLTKEQILDMLKKEGLY